MAGGVGCTVIGGEGVNLGVVAGVGGNGAAPIMEVSPSDQTKGEPQQRLIPYVKGPIVTQVDLDAKTIWVE